VAIFFGAWFGATLVLNTPNPVVVVPSGSMCIPYDGFCDGWSHPFARTLHVGDLLILQGLKPQDYNTNYPFSDIIVFHEAGNPATLIVHRIVAVDDSNGTLFFHTKGDGNGVRWPTPVTPQQYDTYPIEPPEGVAQNMIVGRVIFRIPWLGNIVLLMQTPTGIIAVAIIILLLLIVEFVAPVLKKKPAQATEPAKEA
jgi:signal peptidase I